MFLIISAICINDSPLDYHPTRTVFSSEQRLEQTIETIRSVREYTTERIVHVECGNHINRKFSMDKIKNEVDLFIDLGEDKEVNVAVNSPHKSWAELVSIRAALPKIPQTAEIIYKLSGRYQLTPKFDSALFRTGDITAKLFLEHGPTRCCSVLYSIGGTKRYSELCDYCYSKFGDNKSRSIEEMLYDWASQKSLNVLDILGCRGKIAVNGMVWEE
jgi:hypothetical protein